MAVPVEDVDFPSNYVYYILLEDKFGYEVIQEHGLHSEPRDSPVQVLKGSIVRQKPPVRFLVDRDTEVNVESVDDSTITLTCKKRFLSSLQLREAKLLAAIPNNTDRYTVFMDKNWLKDGDFIGVGLVVDLIDKSQFGKVRYKGKVEGRRGIVFGIELSKVRTIDNTG